MTEDNKASAFVMPPADLSMTSSSMSAKPGVGTEQLSAISAALQALQSNMLTMRLVSDPTTPAEIEAVNINSEKDVAI